MRAVEQTRSGTYRVRFRYRGKQTSETFPGTAAGKRRAATFAKWLDALGPQGALDQLYAAEQAADVPTLDEVAADHIEHLTGVEDGTRLTYRRLWERTWGKHIGRLPANQVGNDDIRRAVNALAARYSHKSLKNQHGLLSAVLGRAVEQGYLTTNPARRVRLPRGREAERVEMTCLSPEQYAEMEARIHDHYQPLVRFLAGTGCRWGEAVALTVGDVALPNVRIRRALKWSPNGERTVGATKTRRSNRTIALPPQLQDDLRALSDGKPRDALVFTAPRGGPVQHRTFWSDIWLPAVADMEPRPRIHDLRHSHASWLLARGVPIHVVQARLGHESIKTTVDTYGHLLPDAQVAAASAAAIALGSATPGLPSSR